MSSAVNHRKRSHRSQKNHYRASQHLMINTYQSQNRKDNPNLRDRLNRVLNHFRNQEK